jgi:hypothetical protein
MTKRDKIKHPGYGESPIMNRDFGFVFSSDINRWMRKKKFYSPINTTSK